MLDKQACHVPSNVISFAVLQHVVLVLFSLQSAIMLGVLLVVIGLASVARSDDVPEICTLPIAESQVAPQSDFNLQIEIYTNSFEKATTYNGKFVMICL